MQLNSTRAEPGNIIQCTIVSNYGGETLELSPVSLNYYESVLDCTVRVTLIIVDSGYRLNSSKTGTVLEGGNIKIGAGELVYLEFEDRMGQVVSFTENNPLMVKEVRSTSSDTSKTTFALDLWSEEATYNSLAKTKVNQRYYGKPSDTVNSILKDNLQTKKNLNIEKSQNILQYMGRGQKPFFCATELAGRSIPTISKASGVLAGFFFYETSQGYNFRSIDTLLKQDYKRSFIANETTAIPEGYTSKIYTFQFQSNYDLESVLFSASFSKSKIKVFDPVTEQYTEDVFDYNEQFMGDNNLGDQFPVISSLWKFENQSRSYVTHSDRGTYTSGKDYKEQLKTSSDENFRVEDVVRQSRSRYNQLYSNRLSFTTSGDLALHAGDLIHCDFPEITSEKSYHDTSSTRSGLYMITDVCHQLTVDSTWTRIHCVRDSFGRKPF